MMKALLENINNYNKYVIISGAICVVVFIVFMSILGIVFINNMYKTKIHKYEQDKLDKLRPNKFNREG